VEANRDATDDQELNVSPVERLEYPWISSSGTALTTSGLG